VTSTLLVAAGVHPVDPEAPDGLRAVLIDGDRITWVGAQPEQAPPHDRAVDLGDAWITPAFVDAHVHGTPTGHATRGLRLAGAVSAAEVLDRLRRFAGADDAPELILGHAWDDFGWPEGRPPTAAEITQAAPGRIVLLTRVDAHSCLVSQPVLDRLPLEQLDGVDTADDGAPTGWLREQASQAALALVRELIPPAEAAAARQAACHAAAELGIATIHEMGHPGLYGLDDAVAWAVGDWPIEVLVWWAELDLDAAVGRGLRPGGDLFLDGSIGTCTAATSRPYGPAGECGELFHDDEAVADWFEACTRAGMGGGVHAIGDRAIEQAVGALERVAARVGLDAVRRCRHRIEHVELPSRDQVARMAHVGAVASVQPAFDAVWGGREQLYAQRFGADAALRSNPLAWFVEEGVGLAFGSDSTVTPLDPLGALAAATGHLGGLSIDAATALAAHTVGGHHVAGVHDAGRCRPGFRADLAVWSHDPLDGLGGPPPRCLATLVRGAVVHGDAFGP